MVIAPQRGLEMSGQIALASMSPSDCTIAFGIPTSAVEYEQHRANPAIHDFASKVSGNLRDYRWAVLRRTDRLLPAIRARGATVATNLSLGDFSVRLNNSQRSVFILVSHWLSDRIEFADGLAPIDRVIDAIPSAFTGILDLCVCHPDSLVKRIRRERPNIGLICWTSAEAMLVLWLHFYLALFAELAAGQKTYLEALDLQLKHVFDALQLHSM